MAHPSGKVSLGGVLFLALLAGGVYAAAMFGPLYVDNFDVKDAVAVAHNRAAQGADDAQLRDTIIERTGRMGTHWETDKFDRDYVVPGLGLKPEQILIERSSVTPRVRIQVDYVRRVRLKPLDRVETVHFRVEKDGIPGQP